MVRVFAHLFLYLRFWKITNVFFLFTVVFVSSQPHSKNVASQTLLANIFLTPTGNKFCRQRQESSWSSECQSEVQISSTSSHERYCIKMVIIIILLLYYYYLLTVLKQAVAKNWQIAQF